MTAASVTDSRKRERRRVNDPEGLRQRVLDVAASLFQRQGYNGTSVQDVVQAAGVTAGAVHHHYPTKKSLVVAVLRERVRRVIEETWIAPVQDAGSVREGVAGVCRAIREELVGERVLGCPLNNLALELSLADMDVRAELGSVFSAWRDALAEQIRIDQARGRLCAHHAEDLATFIVAAYSGAMTMAKAAQQTEPLDACARMLDQLLSG